MAIAVEITVKKMARGEGDQPVLLAAGGAIATGMKTDESDAIDTALYLAKNIVNAAIEKYIVGKREEGSK